MILTALFLSLLTPQETDWPYFGGTNEGDVGIAIDPTSIKREGGARVFLAKMTSRGDERYAMVTMRVDCAKRTMLITHAKMFAEGEMVSDRDEPDGGYSVTDDPATPPVVDYVCAR